MLLGQLVAHSMSTQIGYCASGYRQADARNKKHAKTLTPTPNKNFGFPSSGQTDEATNANAEPNAPPPRPRTPQFQCCKVETKQDQLHQHANISTLKLGGGVGGEIMQIQIRIPRSNIELGGRDAGPRQWYGRKPKHQ